MSNVELTEIRKNFGSVDVIKDVDLSIADGEFVVFVGPSGCGKSTLLRLIAGLENISSGSVNIGGRDVTWSEPAQRGVAMVFQSYALYPHMSVAENMGFGLRMNGATREEIGTRVSRAAAILHLEALLDRKPRQLSGGQRQRVAIGRAIVREPAVFLFDEPLSNLDAELRVQMRLEIAKLHQELGTTMIYVTHDQVEAMTLADTIVIMRDGRIEQVGSPLELYDEPDNQFVAGFLGSPKMNFLRGVVGDTKDGLTTIGLSGFGGSEFRVGLHGRVPARGSGIRIGIRPEHLDATEGVELRGRVDVIEHLGGASYAYAGLDTDVGLTVAVREDRELCAGQDLKVHFRPERAYLFDPETGTRVK